MTASITCPAQDLEARLQPSGLPASGLLHLEGAAAHILPFLSACFAPDSPSFRIGADRSLAACLSISGIDAIAAGLLGGSAFPVRAVFLNKHSAANWALGWHQDRVIAVAERVDVPGFVRWTLKDEIPHCAPPVDILQSMVTLRIHIDPVFPDNAPLLVAPGTHLLGAIPEADIAQRVEQQGSQACLACPGDIWALAPLILHASGSARNRSSRRVLQLDYAYRPLPGGLRWRTL